MTTHRPGRRRPEPMRTLHETDEAYEQRVRAYADATGQPFLLEYARASTRRPARRRRVDPRAIAAGLFFAAAALAAWVAIDPGPGLDGRSFIALAIGGAAIALAASTTD